MSVELRPPTPLAASFAGFARGQDAYSIFCLYLVMAFNELLAGRIREALAHLPDVVEKKMFHGICFMVNGKMCLCVRLDDMLCRIGPHKYGDALEMNHCRPMIHNGRTMTGFVFV